MRTIHTSMTSTFQKKKKKREAQFFYEIFCCTEIYFGFLVAGLDCAKFGSYQFPIFLFIVVIAISILVKTAF